MSRHTAYVDGSDLKAIAPILEARLDALVSQPAVGVRQSVDGKSATWSEALRFCQLSEGLLPCRRSDRHASWWPV